MSVFGHVPEPTVAELRAIEAEEELLMAELALVDAETAWHSRPSLDTAAGYLAALTLVLDLYVMADAAELEVA